MRSQSTPGTVNSDEGDLRTELLLSRRTVTLVATTGGEEDSVAKDEVRWMRKIRRRELPHPKIKCSSTGQYCMEINLISESQRVEAGACAGGAWEVARWPPATKNPGHWPGLCLYGMTDRRRILIYRITAGHKTPQFATQTWIGLSVIES